MTKKTSKKRENLAWPSLGDALAATGGEVAAAPSGKLSDHLPGGFTAGQYLALALLCLDQAGAHEDMQKQTMLAACTELGCDPEGLAGQALNDESYSAWLRSL